MWLNESQTPPAWPEQPSFSMCPGIKWVTPSAGYVSWTQKGDFTCFYWDVNNVVLQSVTLKSQHIEIQTWSFINSLSLSSLNQINPEISETHSSLVRCRVLTDNRRRWCQGRYIWWPESSGCSQCTSYTWCRFYLRGESVRDMGLLRNWYIYGDISASLDLRSLFQRHYPPN